MDTVFAILVVVVPLLGGCWFAWDLRCLNQTYDDRMKVIAFETEFMNNKALQDVYLDDPDFDMNNKTPFFYASYDDHQNALVWFKDPWKLYGPYEEALRIFITDGFSSAP